MKKSIFLTSIAILGMIGIFVACNKQNDNFPTQDNKGLKSVEAQIANIDNVSEYSSAFDISDYEVLKNTSSDFEGNVIYEDGSKVYVALHRDSNKVKITVDSLYEIYAIDENGFYSLLSDYNSNEPILNAGLREAFEDLMPFVPVLQFQDLADKIESVRNPSANINIAQISSSREGVANWSKTRCKKELDQVLGCGGTDNVEMDCICAVGDYFCVCYGECGSASSTH